MHPIQEAEAAERRLLAEARPALDGFLILTYRATNQPPFPLAWLDFKDTNLAHAAILTRIDSKYPQRF